jgi:hypothetical protein
MSDPNVYPVPKKWLGLSNNYDDLNTKLNGLPDIVRGVNGSSPVPANPSDRKSFGAAGLAPYLPALATPLAGAAGAALGAAAPLAGAAYGIGKLVAPKVTDEAVQKVKDFISGHVAPAIQKAGEVGSAYEMGMGEALPGSRFIESKLSPQSQDFITQIKNQHPIAAKAGQVAGIAGSMALPGMNVVKGAGLAGTAANAALNAAPFALGTGLDVGAATGDVKKGVMAGLGSEALGTAIPTAISGLARNPAVNRFLAKMQLAASGVRGGDIQKITRGYAKSLGMSGGAVDTYAAQHADDVINQAADLVGQYGYGRVGKEALKKASTGGFDAHAKLWDDLTGKKIGPDDLAAVMADPDLAPLRARFGDEAVSKAVNQIGQEIDGQGWTNSRGVLAEYGKAGNNFQGLSPKDPKILDATIADVMRDRLDTTADHIMEWAKTGQLGEDIAKQTAEVPSLHILKATYPATLAMTKAAAREAGGISGRFAGGSDTAARQLLMAAPYLVGGGAVAPGAVGDMLQNPENIPQDLLKIGLGSVAGRLLTRGAGRAAEIGSGIAAGGLRKLAGAGGEINPAVSRLLGQTGELAATPAGVGPITGVGALSDTAQPEQAPGPAPVGTVPIPNATPQGAPAINTDGPGPVVPPAPQGPPPPPPPSPQEKGQAQFSQPTAEQPNKIGKWNADMVERRIDEKYSRFVRQYGPYAMTREQYKQGALQATDNLNPMNPATWKGMYDDPATAEKYFKDYLALQKMPLESKTFVADALNHYHRILSLPARIAPEEQQKEEESNSIIVQALSDITKQTPKEIDSRLKQIAFDRGMSGQQKKQAIVDMITREGSIDWNTFHEMGLI